MDRSKKLTTGSNDNIVNTIGTGLTTRSNGKILDKVRTSNTSVHYKHHLNTRYSFTNIPVIMVSYMIDSIRAKPGDLPLGGIVPAAEKLNPMYLIHDLMFQIFKT